MAICKICGQAVTSGVVVHPECLSGYKAHDGADGIVKMLRRLAVERRPEACLGCGYEHRCSVHGCAVIKRAAEMVAGGVGKSAGGWISTQDRPPEAERDGETVLALASGCPCENITLDHALVTAEYFAGEGWVVNEYPEWENPTVTHWMPAPELPKGKRKVVSRLNKPLTQDDISKMHFDKVWLSYEAVSGAELGDGEPAIVLFGKIYSIDVLEGAGFQDALEDMVCGETLDRPSGQYTAYRYPLDGGEIEGGTGGSV